METLTLKEKVRKLVVDLRFEEVLSFEKFLFQVEVVNNQRKNRFPAVFIVRKRVFQYLAYKHELLYSRLLNNVHEFFRGMLLVGRFVIFHEEVEDFEFNFVVWF